MSLVKKRPSSQQASALIMTLAVMLLLSLSGIAFIRSMNQERVAASNFAARVQARLVAYAGLERAICEIVERERNQGYTNDTVKELLYDKSTDPEIEKASVCPDTATFPDRAPISLYDSLISPIQDHYRYLCSGRVGKGRYAQGGDVYSLRIDTIDRALNLNSHISLSADSNRIMHRILTTLATQCGVSSNVADILRPASGPASTYHTMDEVLQKLENNGFNITTPEMQKFLENICVDSWIDKNTSMAANPGRAITDHPLYMTEQRAPVNINLVSYELLYALIRNIRATTWLYYNYTAGSTSVETQPESEKTGTGGASGIVKEEKAQIYNVPIQVSITFDDTVSARIANAIIDYRDDPAGFRPFTDITDFESFIDGLPSGDLPSLPTHHNFNSGKSAELWYQACRDALKSNFNPNSIDNSLNPNRAIYRKVAKADLWAMDNSVSPAIPTCFHTTDLCFSSMGRYHIISFGRVTIKNCSIIIASVTLETVVEIYNLVDIANLRHTTQSDFEIGSTSCYTYPKPRRFFTLPPTSAGYDTPDTYCGGLEPRPNDAPSGTLFSVNFDDACSQFDWGPNTAGTTLISNRASFLGLRRMHAFSPWRYPHTSSYNNYAHDGLLNKVCQVPPGNLAQLQFYSIPAITGNELITTGAADERYYNAQTGTYKIPYYRGALEFWVKLDVDGDEEVHCGLIETLQMSPEQTISSTFREGVQMFIFKNCSGQLRVSRLYFGAFYDTAGNEYGMVNSVTGDPDVGTGTVPNFRYCRRDAVRDISDWKAHTWHHVYIDWDDAASVSGAGQNNLRIFIDGLGGNDTVLQYVGEEATIDIPRAARLNECLPTNQSSDCFFIGGFVRNIREGAKGFFKYGSGMKYFCANATLDGIVTHATNIDPAPTRSRYGTNVTFDGRFTIDTPGGILGPLKWTAYPRYEDSPARSRVEVSAGDGSNMYYQFNHTNASRYGAGLPTNVPVTVNNTPYHIDYTVTFILVDNECPALESIQLTYIRPRLIYLEER